mmetsp:Transcript_25445/g.61169  ORF Transcript_25445/g.61169 Transcript_25445/m.61169 type:complete len:254 (+) Transcript_25445:70-831(+)
MMKNFAATLLIIVFARISGASSFVPSKTGNPRRTHPLFGTIRFVGNASARLETPPVTATGDRDDDRTLSKFIASSASNPVLLGAKEDSKGAISQCERIDSDDDESAGELWECKQAGVGWFGMTIVPIFVNRIEKNLPGGDLVISIIDAKTEVQSGGRVGNTLASAMKRSKFEGRNAVAWKEQNDGSTNDGAQSYVLNGDLKLTLTITLPPFLPIPPGFNTIGSKIVERTCKERLQQNLRDISNAYLIWATSPE